MIRFLTLIADSPDGGDKMFGTPRIGNLYYDNTRSAHEKYTISTGKGAVVILRPDGILGYAIALDDIESIKKFFADFTSII